MKKCKNVEIFKIEKKRDGKIGYISFENMNGDRDYIVAPINLERDNIVADLSVKYSENISYIPPLEPAYDPNQLEIQFPKDENKD